MHNVEIRTQGRLDKKWADWLEGFTITHTDEQETLLAGKVTDQAAFYGVIAKLRDLGVKLITANFSDEGSDNHSDEPGLTGN
jgi:hypothetical protein